MAEPRRGFAKATSDPAAACVPGDVGHNEDRDEEIIPGR